MLNALTSMMKPKSEPLPVVTLLSLLLQEAELSQEDEERGKVLAVPAVPRAVPDPQVADPYTAGDPADPPRGPVRAVQNTRSGGSTLASEETPELREAHVRDTFRTSVTLEDVSSDIGPPADITSVKVFALRAINAITHMSS